MKVARHGAGITLMIVPATQAFISLVICGSNDLQQTSANIERPHRSEAATELNCRSSSNAQIAKMHLKVQASPFPQPTAGHQVKDAVHQNEAIFLGNF